MLNNIPILKRSHFTVLLILILMMPLNASSQLSETIGYQGVLADGAGNPVDATVSITFAIYDAASAGNKLWEETHPSVIVANGIFNAQLGSVQTFSSAGLAFDRPYFLGINVASDGEMLPRLELSMAPASLAAGGATAEVTVDCAAGETIQDAIDKAWLGRALVVNVNGNCEGNVAVRRDDITLKGAGTDQITGVTPHANADINAVVYSTARGLVIENLIIEGPPGDATGISGLLLFNNASAEVFNGTVIRNHDGFGVIIVESSNIDLFGTTVHNNGETRGWSGVFVNQNSHLDTRDGTVIRDNGAHGIYLRLSSSATIEDTQIQTNGDPARDDIWSNGLHLEDGSAARLRGGNIITTDMPYGDVGVAIAAYRGSVVRIAGTNTITAPTANFDPDNICSLCATSGGMAMDIEMNSTVRQQNGKSIITGWIEAYNGSTVDLRNTELTGHLESALFSNFRLRDQSPGDGTPTLNGNVILWGYSVLSIRTDSSTQRAIINGKVYCRNDAGTASNGIKFQDADDGYVGCTNAPTDVAVAVIDNPDPVSVGVPITYQVTMSNTSSNPSVGLTTAQFNYSLNGPSFRVDSATYPGGSCGTGGSCFLGNLPAGDSVTVDIVVTPLVAGVVSINVTSNTPHPDTNPNNNNANESTTVSP